MTTEHDFAIACAIVVLGALALTAFGIWLAKKSHHYDDDGHQAHS